MDVVSLCPLRVSGFVWQSRSGAHALTVIVKATYLLQQGECTLAPEQDAPNDREVPWNDEGARSVYAPSDRVPLKSCADVVLVGHAYAPGGQPVRSVMTRMVVGSVDKSIEVWCDGGYRVHDGQLLEGPRFAKSPLRWERAAGGPETLNPAGMRFDAAPDRYGMVAIPNLQPPGTYVAKAGDTFTPVGFGPIAASWPWRRQMLGRHVGAWSEGAGARRPLPEDMNYGYFNTAPVDQQVDELRENERIVLENLHPEHARLVTSLPGLKPRAVVERAAGGREEVELRADTLWIDTDRGQCTLVWRGQVGLSYPQEAGRVAVLIEGAEGEDDDGMQETLPPAAFRADEDDAGEDYAGMTLAPGVDLAKMVGPVMPFLGAGKVQAPSASSSSGPRVADAALPFGRTGGIAPGSVRGPELPVVPPPPPGEGTLFAPMGRRASAPAMPAVAIPPPVPPVPPPVVAPPPIVMRPPVVETSVPVVEAKATLGQMMAQMPAAAPKESAAAAPAPVALKAEPEAAPAAVDEAAAKRGWKPVVVKSGDGSKGPPLSPNPVLGGAAAASDAAAGANRAREGGERRVVSAAASVSPPKAVIELLWYDPAAMPRIRRQAGWKEILGQIKGKAFEDELSGDSPPEKRQEARDRRDVAGLLARGDAVDMAGIEAALANAVTEDGTFVPPLVLVAGELEFPFDELETLKATMAALAPLASGDKALKEQLDTTEELLKTPWLKGASGIAEGLTAKLKEVFGRGSRMLPPRYLEGHTERMLLEQRAYQKRTVLGKKCIRALLAVPGAQGGGMPVYLPEALGEELPAFQRFGVRMVGEVRGRVDQYEGQEVAVKSIGLAKQLHTRFQKQLQ